MKHGYFTILRVQKTIIKKALEFYETWLFHHTKNTENYYKKALEFYETWLLNIYDTFLRSC